MATTIWFQELFGQWGCLIALALALIINLPIFIWARLKHHLTLWGSIVAGFFGISYWLINPVFYLGLFTFFISSSFLTRYHKSVKEPFLDKFEKGGERDASQVLANGLAGFLFIVGYLLTILFSNNFLISNAFIYGFIAAIGTVNADTWATEIGIVSKDQPYWILNLKKKVERGTSGGVSAKGTAAAFLGSLVIGSLILLVESFWHNPIHSESSWQLLLFIAVAIVCGFLGSIIDSFFGATIQGFFECTVCQKGTEKKIHCSQPTKLIRGLKNFRNDHVNFWSSFIAGLLAFGFGCFAYLL